MCHLGQPPYNNNVHSETTVADTRVRGQGGLDITYLAPISFSPNPGSAPGQVASCTALFAIKVNHPNNNIQSGTSM